MPVQKAYSQMIIFQSGIPGSYTFFFANVVSSISCITLAEFCCGVLAGQLAASGLGPGGVDSWVPRTKANKEPALHTSKN